MYNVRRIVDREEYTDLRLRPAGVRVGKRERRRIVRDHNEALIQQLQVVYGIVISHQKRHRFRAAATEALRTSVAQAQGRRRRK